MLKRYIEQHRGYEIEISLVKNEYWRWSVSVYKYATQVGEPERVFKGSFNSNFRFLLRVLEHAHDYVDIIADREEQGANRCAVGSRECGPRPGTCPGGAPQGSKGAPGKCDC